MRVPRFSRIRSATPVLELIQDAIQRFTRPLEVNPFLDGRSMTATLVAGTPQALVHNIGRVPTDWWVTDINAASSVFRTAWTETTITIDCSVNCTVRIWVS